MIMPNSTSTLATNADVTGFGIEMNASMFQMLTKNVYNDVILAPIREFSTNAIDACIAAKKPIKFDVHLPTEADTTFFVRDYGTGLPHEDIIGLFSLLGASTKRGSNEYNGTFGIGRMSGLAYASSFTVDSYYEGKKLSYVVSMNDGIPSTVHLGDTDTTEENGLKLGLQVKYSDIISFHKKAKHLYRFFEHKPNLNITLDLSIDKNIEGENWFTTNNLEYGYALMGNVPYKLDPYSFNSQSARAILDAKPVLEVPLGAVSITPGRESLTLDEETLKYLTNRLEAINKEIVQKAIDAVDDTADTYDKMIQINSILETLPYYLKTSFKYPFTLREKEFFSQDSYGVNFKQNANFPDSRLMFMSSYNLTMKNILNTYNDPALKGLVFMIGDTRTYVKDAVLSYRSTFDSKPHVIAVVQDKFNKDTNEEFVKDTIKIFQELGLPYALASDYNSHIESKSRKKVEGFVPLHIGTSGDGAYACKGSSRIENFDIDTTFYVPTHNHDIQMDLTELNLLLRYKDLYNFEYGTKYAVIGVPKKYLDDVKEAGYKVVDKLRELDQPLHFYDGSGEYEQYDRLRYHLRRMDLDELRTRVENEEIKQYLTDMYAFSKIYKQSRYKTDGIVENFLTETVEPTNTMTLNDFKNKYPTFDTALQYFTITEFNRYIELENTYNEVHKTGQ